MPAISHPPHLKTALSSALIPLCAYRSKWLASNISFPGMPMNVTLCSSFRPTILEGQLCYELTLNRSSGQGKGNALVLLLDYNEDRSVQIPTDVKRKEYSRKNVRAAVGPSALAAKVQIETLSPYQGFGQGIYKMSVVKRMTAKNDFLKLPLKNRNCEVELYQDCRKRHLLSSCGCLPLEALHIEVILLPDNAL